MYIKYNVTAIPQLSPCRVKVSENLFLYCKVEGLPMHTTQWYKKGVLVPKQSLVYCLVPNCTMYTYEAKNH